MLMYLFKNSKSLRENYNKIYDIKFKKIYSLYLLLIVILLVSLFLPAPSNYLISLSNKSKLKGVDNIYDYYVPLSFAIVLLFSFFNDYNATTYKIITFLNRNKFNYIIFYRWLLYTSIFCLGTFLTCMIYYRDISFLDIRSIILSIRFIPNIIFISSLVMLSLTYFKNISVSILILSIYYCLDFTSSGHLFNLLSLGGNSNNFYYIISPLYYILNRIILLILGFLFIFISCKKSSKL